MKTVSYSVAKGRPDRVHAINDGEGERMVHGRGHLLTLCNRIIPNSAIGRSMEIGEETAKVNCTACRNRMAQLMALRMQQSTTH